MERLAMIHPSIKQYRAIGLFGCFDVHDVDGCHPKLPYESAANAPSYDDQRMDAYQKYIQAYDDNGLIGLHRYPHIHCAPPLIIQNDELYEGFRRLHHAVLVLDDALGFK
jgi:adenosylmethionine-8-amino-7-oxononanoate aminotransferase